MVSPSSTTRPGDNASRPISLRTVALGTVLVLLMALGFWLLVVLRPVLMTLFFGLLVATSLRAVVDWMHRFNIPRSLAAGGTILLLIGLALLFLALTLPSAFEQARSLSEELPLFYGRLRTALIESPYLVVRQFGASMAPALPTGGSSFVPGFAGIAFAWLPSIGYGLFVGISALLLTYYWLLYRERSVRGVILLLPMAYRDDAEALWLQIEAKLGAFLRSQLLLMLIVGLISLVGFWLIGLPYALLLAFATGVLELIPFIGPIVSTALAVAVGLSVSPSLGLAALVVGLVIQQFEGNVLAPRIVDRVLGVSPVVTLLALVGFTALFGLAGTLLAIPLAAVLQVLFEHWLARASSALHGDPIEGGRSLVARLRYELQDLAQDVRSQLRRKDNEVNRRSDQAEEELEQILLSLDTLLKQHEQRNL